MLMRLSQGMKTLTKAQSLLIHRFSFELHKDGRPPMQPAIIIYGTPTLTPIINCKIPND